MTEQIAAKRYWVLSTGHLTFKTRAFMAEKAGTPECFICTSNKDYGWYVPVLDTPNQMHEEPQDYPGELMHILMLAIKAGVTLVQFDRDEPANELLPYYAAETGDA